MYHETAYDTTLGRLTSNTADLTSSIEKYIVVDYPFLKKARLTSSFATNDRTVKAVYLTGMGTTEEDIPNFAHSFLYNNQWLATDLRPYLNADKNTASFTVRNEYEYSLALQRAILSGKWALRESSPLYNFKFPHDCFAAWLSETLAKRFGLNPNDQIKIQALCYIYYTSLFLDEPLNDQDFGMLMVKIRSNTFLTTELVTEVYKSIQFKMDGIEDFCRELYNVTSNVRLKGMTVSVLLTIVATNWYGHNAKELVSVCLEHPPTWIAMVYASLNLRSFKNTYISNVVNKHDKRGAGEAFMREYLAVTKSYLLHSDHHSV